MLEDRLHRRQKIRIRRRAAKTGHKGDFSRRFDLQVKQRAGEIVLKVGKRPARGGVEIADHFETLAHRKRHAFIDRANRYLIVALPTDRDLIAADASRVLGDLSVVIWRDDLIAKLARTGAHILVERVSDRLGQLMHRRGQVWRSEEHT